MDKRKRALVLAVLFATVFLVPVAARAEVSAKHPKNLKIGVVDLQKALNTSAKGKKAKEELKAEFKKKSKEIEAKKAKVEALRKELQKKASLMSPKAQKAKEEEYRSKLRELKHAIDDAKAELATKENELSSQILKELVKLVRAKGKKEGFSLILEANGGVIYSDGALDLTNSVIKEYDGSYGLRSSSKKRRAGKKK